MRREALQLLTNMLASLLRRSIHQARFLQQCSDSSGQTLAIKGGLHGNDVREDFRRRGPEERLRSIAFYTPRRAMQARRQISGAGPSTNNANAFPTICAQ